MPGSAGEAGGPRRTLHLMMPYKEERDSGGKVTMKKVRFTVADLQSNGEITSTFATNSAANVPGSAGEADELRHPDAGLV